MNSTCEYRESTASGYFIARSWDQSLSDAVAVKLGYVLESLRERLKKKKKKKKTPMPGSHLQSSLSTILVLSDAAQIVLPAIKFDTTASEDASPTSSH